MSYVLTAIISMIFGAWLKTENCEAEREAKICAGGCVRNYADPLAHCDGCSLNEERKKNDDRN